MLYIHSGLQQIHRCAVQELKAFTACTAHQVPTRQNAQSDTEATTACATASKNLVTHTAAYLSSHSLHTTPALCLQSNGSSPVVPLSPVHTVRLQSLDNLTACPAQQVCTAKASSVALQDCPCQSQHLRSGRAVSQRPQSPQPAQQPCSASVIAASHTCHAALKDIAACMAAWSQ